MNARGTPGIRGFSLVELTAVVAVTAVMIGVGTSAYRTYSVRAQIASGIALAKTAQSYVEHTYATLGEPPADGDGTDLLHARDDTTVIESIDVTNGRVGLRFAAGADSALAGRTLFLTPFETASREVVWVCGNRLPGPGLNTLGFAFGGRRPAQLVTAIESRYLPSTCR